MDFLIKKYLDSHYTFDGDTFLDYKNDEVNGYKLMTKISSMFDIEEGAAKYIIRNYIREIEPDFNFENYFCELFFPRFRAVTGTTVGHDIVTVQPMAAPNPNYSLDYISDVTFIGGQDNSYSNIIGGVDACTYSNNEITISRSHEVGDVRYHSETNGLQYYNGYNLENIG